MCMRTHTQSICMHTFGMHTHTLCMRMHTRAQKCRFRVHNFFLFYLVLITCLGHVESSFHMFSIRVSRITCFTCLD